MQETKPKFVSVRVKFFQIRTHWYQQHSHVTGLLEGLGSRLLSTATCSAALLVSAAQRGWLDFPSLLSALVSQAAFIHHYPPAVHAIVKLLLWEMKVTLQLKQRYACPYSLK